ncbi:MAG TPA: aspartate kinase, partial [Planctomycetota bacterium]|nr:aspartate kinase [Planctomycetota bacterium]
MRRDPVIVLKLGGSVLAGEESLPVAVHEIYRWRRSGFAVVAVVSALAGDTEALLARAARDGEPSSPHATAALAKLGELRSAALLGVQLEQAGVPARVLMPAALRLRARGDPLDAHPVSLDATPLRRAFAAGDVAVVPGFFAHDAEGRAVLFGRGGSDLTALFLSARLRARCRLLKDVDGLYTGDPNAPGPAPIRYAEAS